jgi:hypothetical protein
MVDPEIMSMDAFLAELDADLAEMEIAMDLDAGILTTPPKELKIQLEVCNELNCDACKEDCSDQPLACDPDLMKRRPELFNCSHEELLNRYAINEGTASGLKAISDKNIESLMTKVFGKTERGSGEYCRNCVYWQLDPRTEGKTHYSEGNCTVDNWKRHNAFDWCKCFSRKKKP